MSDDPFAKISAAFNAAATASMIERWSKVRALPELDALYLAVDALPASDDRSDALALLSFTEDLETFEKLAQRIRSPEARAFLNDAIAAITQAAALEAAEVLNERGS